MVKMETINWIIVRPEYLPQAQSETIRGHLYNYNQTGSDVRERILCHEGEQQEEYCYHGDEDASRDPRSTCETKIFDAYYTFHRSTKLSTMAVFVGLDMSKEEMRTTSEGPICRCICCLFF